MKKWILLIVLLTCINAFSQGILQDSIDVYFKEIEKFASNKNKYKKYFFNKDFLLEQNKKAQDAEKVNLLLDLYTAYVYESAEVAGRYNQEALELAKAIKYDEGVFRGKCNQAYLMFVKGDFDNSMNLIESIEKSIGLHNFPKVYGNLKAIKSYIYTERGEYDLALETGLKLLDNAEKIKSNHLFMRAYGALSHYYLRVENFSKSLSFCVKSLYYIIELKKTQYFYFKIDEIARMTAKLGYNKRALEVYDFYLKMEKQLPPPGSYVQSIVYMNISDIYINNKEYEKAQFYLTKALEINYEKDYRFRVPRALILQAELYLKTKDTTNAILYYEKSLEAAESIDAFDVVKSNSQILTELYKEQDNATKAYEYQNLYEAIKDSLFNNEHEQKIVILETRREVKEVLQKKKILELENEAQKAKIVSIVIVLLFITLISVFVAIAYFKVKKNNKLLYRKTLELAVTQSQLTEQILSMNKESEEVIEKEEQINIAEASKKNQNLDTDTKTHILYRLNKLEKENFFLNPNCNLHEVSALLKTNPKYLSQVINKEKKVNFNNYINNLRINHLLSKLLVDYEFRNNKLSYIAVSVGFNNLNTFTSAFKKRQGILPSYFIKELNKDFQNETA